MPASDAPYHYRTLDQYDHDHFAWFSVKISPEGPRGGKRPPLFHGKFQARDFDEAVEYAKSQVFNTTSIEVTW